MIDKWYQVYEHVDGWVIKLPRLRYVKLEFALKAARRMKKKNPNRKLWIELL